MNLIELQRALRQLRLGGIAEVLETRRFDNVKRAHPDRVKRTHPLVNGS